MSPNEMTAQQCADWLAERDGWAPFNGGWRREIPERREYEYRDTHPLPLTLDAAAGALPPTWSLAKVSHYGPFWACHIERFKPTCERMIVDAVDELTARYRAAVAARMEEDK